MFSFLHMVFDLIKGGTIMRNFVRLYLKDYVIKALLVALFFIVKFLQFLLSLFSIFYGLLKYPIIGFSILGIIVELTCSPIRYGLIFIFLGVASFFILFRYLEPSIFSFFTGYSERLKNRILRPVSLKTKISTPAHPSMLILHHHL